AKNKRGSRSLRLKLEVDEGIAVSLSENDSAGHQGPGRGHDPARQTRYGRFDVALAHRPMHQNHADRDDTDLQHFAGCKNGVAINRRSRWPRTESGNYLSDESQGREPRRWRRWNSRRNRKRFGRQMP